MATTCTHDLVNFDVLAKENVATVKGHLSGSMESVFKIVYVLPDEDIIQNMTKAELVQHLNASISSAYTSDERDLRLGVVRRTNRKIEEEQVLL